MKKLIVFFLFALPFLSCQDEVESECSTHAIVRDLTGLDGCGFVFELDNGERLIPVFQFYCGTPPLPAEVTKDPLYDFEYVDGKHVKLSYEQTHGLTNICMAGTLVKITCIREVSSADEN